MSPEEYTIETDEFAYKLREKVRAAIKQGWVPFGGVSCSLAYIGSCKEELWAQAMIKPQPTETP